MYTRYYIRDPISRAKDIPESLIPCYPPSQREAERQIAEERHRQQMTMAELHYDRSLLKYRGIVPLRKLVQMARQQEMTAAQHYTHTLQRLVAMGMVYVLLLMLCVTKVNVVFVFSFIADFNLHVLLTHLNSYLRNNILCTNL